MKKIYPKRSFAGMVLFAICVTANAQNIKALFPTEKIYLKLAKPYNYNLNSQRAFAVLNGVCYFAAGEDYNSLKLWRSDGTDTGTSPVTGKMKMIYNIDTLNGMLYIASDQGQFVSDGTDAGTQPLLPAYANLVSTKFVNYNGSVYFGGGTSAGSTLYKTDGTAPGTITISSFNYFTNFRFLKINGLMLITEDPDESNALQGALYYTDGTTVATTRWGSQQNLTVLNDSFYYSEDGDLFSGQLQPDIANLLPNPGGVKVADGKAFTVLNGALYFSGKTAATGSELYKYEPLSGNITLVKDVVPGATGSNIDVNNMLVIGDTLYFAATAGNGNLQLWKTNGTGAGTLLVKEFTPALSSQFNNFTNVNGTLYFSLHTAANSYSVWKTDGTAAGAVQLYSGGNGASHLTALGSNLILANNDGADVELWTGDGTGSGLKPLVPFNHAVHHPVVDAQQIIAYNNRFIFNGTDTAHGSELWVTDGSTGGTQLIKEFLPGRSGGNPGSFKVFKNEVYFIVDSAASLQLWKTNGTTAGTVFITYLPGNAPTAQIVGATDSLLFIYKPETSHPSPPPTIDPQGAIWRSDGTQAGTFVVSNSAADVSYPLAAYGGEGGNPLRVASGKNFFYFTGAGYFLDHTGDRDGHDAYWIAVYRTDGSAATPVQVAYLVGQLSPVGFGNVFSTLGDRLFFTSDFGFLTVDAAGNLTSTGHNAQDAWVLKNKLYFNDGHLNTLDSSGNYVLVKQNFGLQNNPVAWTDGKIYFTTGSKLGVFNDAGATVNYIDNIQNVAYGTNKIFFTTGTMVGETDGTATGTITYTDTILPFTATDNIYIAGDHIVFKAQTAGLSDLMLYGLGVDNPLPVTAMALTAKLANGNGILNWSTATEQNSDRFIVERSTDGRLFSQLSSVKAAGNSNFRNDYTYTDYNVIKQAADKLYYRIQQVDKDGRTAYSNTVLLHPYLDFSALASPVPVANILNVSINSAKAQTVQLIITDINGKVLLTGKKTIDIGSNKLRYNTGGWAAGVYLVQLTQADGTKQTIKVVK